MNQDSSFIFLDLGIVMNRMSQGFGVLDFHPWARVFRAGRKPAAG